MNFFETEMKALVIIIAFFLSFSQAVLIPVWTDEKVVLAVEDQGNSQESENCISLDDDDEIEFTETSCLPLVAVIDQGETIYADAIGLKSNFYFCLWRPPRV